MFGNLSRNPVIPQGEAEDRNYLGGQFWRRRFLPLTVSGVDSATFDRTAGNKGITEIPMQAEAGVFQYPDRVIDNHIPSQSRGKLDLAGILPRWRQGGELIGAGDRRLDLTGFALFR